MASRWTLSTRQTAAKEKMMAIQKRSSAPLLQRLAAILALCALAMSSFGDGDPRLRIQSNVGGRDAPVPKGGYADDEVFGVTQGGDLDNYLFRRDRPGGLRFTIPIGRAFLGYDASPRDLAQIIVNAKFVMSVYDVDQDGSPCPEVDVVTINGHPIPDKPTLSGSNNGWSTYSWNIPPDWFVSGKIRLGQLSLFGGPSPGQNEIKIDIDTQCQDTWAVQVDWGAFYIRAVRPIVFVHGMRDSPQSWRNVGGRAGMANWVPGQILHFSRAGSFTGISENAPDIRDAIELRGTLEGLAARLAAERGCGTAALAGLRDCVARIDELLAAPSLSEAAFAAYGEHNARFHALLAEACGSALVQRQLERACTLPFASPNAFVMLRTTGTAARDRLLVAHEQHRAVVHHHHGASTKQVRPQMIWESHRSLLRYFSKHLHGMARAALPLLAILIYVAAFLRARGYHAGFRTDHHDM